MGDIPRTNHMIGKLKPGDLKPLHSIMFDRPGKVRGQRSSRGGDEVKGSCEGSVRVRSEQLKPYRRPASR